MHLQIEEERWVVTRDSKKQRNEMEEDNINSVVPTVACVQPRYVQ